MRYRFLGLAAILTFLGCSLLPVQTYADGHIPFELGPTGTVDDEDAPPPAQPPQPESSPPPIDGDVDPSPEAKPDQLAPAPLLFSTTVDENTLTVPVDLSDSILYQSKDGPTVAITREHATAGNSSGTLVAPGVAAFSDTAHDTATLVLDLTIADGTGFAILEVLASAAAPEHFRYDVALEDGYSLQPDHAGGLLLRGPDGILSPIVAPPWAFDSAGNAVPVEFTLDGPSLVMRVQHRLYDNIAYPVIADPCWSCLKKAVTGIAKTVGGIAAGTGAFAAGAVAVLTYNPAAASLAVPLLRTSVGLISSGVRDLQRAAEENRRYRSGQYN